LRRLEYRGYDSAGIAVLDHGRTAVQKNDQKVDNLVRQVEAEGMRLTNAAQNVLSPESRAGNARADEDTDHDKYCHACVS